MKNETKTWAWVAFWIFLGCMMLIVPAYAGHPKTPNIDVRQSNDMNNQTSGDVRVKGVNENYNRNKNYNISNNDIKNKNHQGQLQGQQQKMQQGQQLNLESNPSASARIGDTLNSNSSAAMATNEGVTVNTPVTISNPDDIEIENVPNIGLGGVFPAGICMKPVEGALAIKGLGLGGGGVFIDEVCQQLEWTRMAYTMGLRKAAVHSLCNMPQADDNPHCDDAQDYTRELLLLEADNAEFLKQYEEDQRELRRLRDEVEAERLRKATTK